MALQLTGRIGQGRGSRKGHRRVDYITMAGLPGSGQGQGQGPRQRLSSKGKGGGDGGPAAGGVDVISTR